MTVEEMIIDELSKQGEDIKKLLEEVYVLRTKVYFFGIIGGFLAGIISSVVIAVLTTNF